MGLSDRELLVLNTFKSECDLLDEAVRMYLKKSITEEDGELYTKGLVYFDPIDPIVERGVVALTRLFLTDETLALPRVANIISRKFTNNPDRVKEIRKIKDDFNRIKKFEFEIFDRYANVGYLHFDIDDYDRYVEHFNILHSCRGVPDHARLCEVMIRVSKITKQLSDEHIDDTIKLIQQIAY